MDSGRLVLVTGANGFVGSSLIPRLLERGYHVRALVRDPDRLAVKPWFKQVEIVQGDLLDPADLSQALAGVSTAFYLVHNMSGGRFYMEMEAESARNFARAAERAGLDHIIYLGGLGDMNLSIGSHMRSRIRTGEALRQGRTPVTEFRASLVIGSGSISFELIRYLVEQLPIWIGRRWVLNRTQPIDIRNVLEYLLHALEDPALRGKVYEIGGPDILTYREAMLAYARARGLRRAMLLLPWLPLDGMAFLAGRLTPVPAAIARPLIESMRGDSLVTSDLARRDFPSIVPIRYSDSITNAISRLTPDGLEWRPPANFTSLAARQRGFFIEAAQVRHLASSQATYLAVTSLGGRTGWLYLNWLWRLRGFIDRLVGGVGMRKRAEAGSLKEGDTLDFYRVVLLEEGRKMRLQAELKAPGLGWMEWRVEPLPEGRSSLTQIAYFAPKGLAGYVYWYLLLPFHRLTFSGLIKALSRRAEESQKE